MIIIYEKFACAIIYVICCQALKKFLSLPFHSFLLCFRFSSQSIGRVSPSIQSFKPFTQYKTFHRLKRSSSHDRTYTDHSNRNWFIIPITFELKSPRVDLPDFLPPSYLTYPSQSTKNVTRSTMVRQHAIRTHDYTLRAISAVVFVDIENWSALSVVEWNRRFFFSTPLGLFRIFNSTHPHASHMLNSYLLAFCYLVV